ncbi:MAG: hypothetical protein ISR00_02670 [Flavobacteriales bacterium]|nr:hypothetical protein [Flavobacteriales bacterium]MBL6872835.1 hypothetical protein [Flavobacteriales bacterium]
MDFKLHQLPKSLRFSLSVFLLALAFGYFSGLDMLKHTTDFKAEGIQENVLGNEFDEQADELHFKMSERELHGIIHSHVITLSLLFVVLSLMVYFTTLPAFFKSVLMIEPTLSLIVTFGGLWMMWHGITWVKYVIMVSGILMHLSIVCMVLVLLKNLLLTKN